MKHISGTYKSKVGNHHASSYQSLSSATIHTTFILVFVFGIILANVHPILNVLD